MSFKHILQEKIGPVGRILLNRPDVGNAQDRLLLDELDEALTDFGRDDEVRVVVIGSVGKHFSSGHDLKSARVERPNPTVEERWEYEESRFLEYCLNIYDFKKPTIAQVQGACVAGGFMVANMCDLIVCSVDAFFCDPVTHSMGAASLEVLIHPWVMSMRKAKELIFTGARMSAAEAQEVGMINKVVSREELEAETMALANRIAEAPPYGLRFTKRSLNRTWDAQGFRAAITAHFDLHQLSHVTEEFQMHLRKGLDSTIKRAKKMD